MIEHNTVTKQLHPKHLTQWSTPQYYFWKGGQATFPAFSSSPHSTYCWWGSYQMLVVESQRVWVWSNSHSWTTRESWRSGLDGSGLVNWDNTFLQRASLCFAKCAYTEGCPGDLYDGAFQPLHERSSLISEQTQGHCVWRQTYTMSCNTLPMACKLKPAHHLLS